MMGKSCVDVLRDVTGDNGIETVAEGLEKALGGGGGALPEVTAEDNGKVLTVVDGEWDKANSGGGGGGVFVVNFEEVEQGKLSADKTFEEIDAAMLGGQIVIGVLHVVVGGSMRVFDGYGFVICATGRYNVVFNDFTYSAQSGDDYWVASQS